MERVRGIERMERIRGVERIEGVKGVDGRGHCGNKVNSMVEESNSSEASVYYLIIYWCYQGLMVFG